MNKALSTAIFLFLFFSGAYAQNVVSDTAAVMAADTLELKYDTYDDILRNMGPSIVMSDSLEKAMSYQMGKNKGRRTMGYRVRIYFDNSQSARAVSQSVADTFAKYNPDVPVYRSYDNPYFKVTVGEFFTKSDAMRFIAQIRKKYPSAFLVREPFSTI